MGREDSAPKSFVVARAEAVDTAEGSIWAAASARLSGAPESLARGTLSEGFSRNLGDLHVSSCKRRVRFARQQGTRLRPVRVHRNGERRSVRRKRYRAVKGNRRLNGKGKAGVL